MKMELRKKHNEDDCFFLSASGNATQSVTQKSVTSELEVESLPEDQPSELLTQTKQTKPQPLTEMPVNLHCLAPNTFFMRSECLNIVKQSCLRFGNSSYPSTSNLELRKLFCRSSGVRISYPECIRSQPSVEVDGKAGWEISAPPAPYVANPINFLDSICNTRALLSLTGGDAHLQSRTRFETGAEILVMVNEIVQMCRKFELMLGKTLGCL